MPLSPKENFTMVIYILAGFSDYSLLFNVFLPHEDVDMTIHYSGLFGLFYMHIDLIFDTLYFIT